MSLSGYMGGPTLEKILSRTYNKKHKPQFTKKIKSKRLLKKLKEQRANNTL